MPTLIRGDRILDDVITGFRQMLPSGGGKTVVVVEFDHYPGASPTYHLASRVSAAAKGQAFHRAGLTVEAPLVTGRTSPAAFRDLLLEWSGRDDVAGVIMQRPFAPEFQAVTSALAPQKDLDATHSGRLSATAEAVCRVVRAFATGGDVLVVVGGRGAVGGHVVRELQSAMETIVIDAGDDLAALDRASIVVTAVGQAGLLGAAHLRPWHRLIVDVGFVPSSLVPLVASGDTDPAAWPQNCYVTPVPGGIGPLQISVLLERVSELVTDTAPVPWSISPHSFEVVAR